MKITINKKLSRNLYRILFAVFIFSGLQACAVNVALLEPADSVQKLAPDEIIVVGEVSLRPKLEKSEQNFAPPSGTLMIGDPPDGIFRNRALLQFNNKPASEGFRHIVNAEFDKVFFFKVKRDMNYIVDGSISMELYDFHFKRGMQLPAWFKFNVKPGDKAVYIGKITYSRDDFNTITKIKFSDNYKKALKKFKKRFGKKIKLRKSLLTKIKSK